METMNKAIVFKAQTRGWVAVIPTMRGTDIRYLETWEAAYALSLASLSAPECLLVRDLIEGRI